eukprot:TRINITY_DN68887_c0_g1_i1.p1 TRINITY_DN68887_c0_g1~~TRINITY_DN68887_c0_g1_i1.p1  ORF type:complete len:569 (-),score=76.49 TRINITY_DN68887_c0_g1_i1:24-1730(-)
MVTPWCDGVSADVGAALLPIAVELGITHSEYATCASMVLLSHLLACRRIRPCSLYWFFMVFLFGKNGMYPYRDAGVWPWLVILANVTKHMKSERSAEMRRRQDTIAEFDRYSRSVTDADAEAASMLLVYGDSPAYFKRADVAPFMHQLRCYADARGMQFVVDVKGSRVWHKNLVSYGVSINNNSGFYITARGEIGDRSQNCLQSLIKDFVEGRLERVGNLSQHIDGLAANYRDPYVFGRIWALEENLSRVGQGGLAIYYDPDVTIRPDAWDESLISHLLAEAGGSNGHIFIADTWPGIECVNGGFLAVRNTPIARVFIEMWKEKMFWAGTWTQGALAETVLEILGMEVKLRTKGRYSYSHSCLLEMMPFPDGMLAYQSYCDCWVTTVNNLVGPYRHRNSHIVTFVDPERVAVNFVPNNLFVHHNFELSKMRLVPDSGRPSLTPFVVHWAGLGHQRLGLVREFFKANYNTTFGTRRCARPSRPAPVHEGLGTQARHIRCCEYQRQRPNWRNEKDADVAWWYWGCSASPSVTEGDCQRLLGADSDKDGRTTKQAIVDLVLASPSPSAKKA